MAAIFGAAQALPVPSNGWFNYRCIPLQNDMFGMVRTNVDLRDGYKPLDGPLARESAKLRLSIFDAYSERAFFELPYGIFPEIDCFPDGRWLIAAARAESWERNAQIYAPDGKLLKQFGLGDAIEHIRCGVDGTIWVGYFDEGIFGSNPRSKLGIAQFDADGKLIRGLNSADMQVPSVDSCYAMALSETSLWACYYSDFAIVRIDNWTCTMWTNALGGARSLAVDGNHVLLAGGYRENYNRIALMRLMHGKAEHRAELRLTSMKPMTQLRGQDATLHVINHERWWKLDVATVRKALEAKPRDGDRSAP